MLLLVRFFFFLPEYSTCYQFIKELKTHDSYEVYIFDEIME